MAFPTTSVIDGGTSPVENPIATNWDGPLISGHQQLQRTSTGIARGTSTSDSYIDLGSYGPNVEVYATIAVLTAGTNTTEGYLYARVQGEGTATIDGYAVNVNRQATADSDRMRLIRTDDTGTDVVLGTYVIGTIVPGTDRYGIEIIGDQLTAYYNNGGGWVARIGPVTDTTYSAAGRIGLLMARSDSRLTNFGGGTYTPPDTVDYNINVHRRGR